MAIGIGAYDHTTQLFMGGTMPMLSTVLRLKLLDDNAVFDPAHTTLAEVDSSGTYEVSGSGWPAGGVQLANLAVSAFDVNGAALTADDISILATGGAIGTAYFAVLYHADGADNPPLFFIDFGGARIASEGNMFQVPWSDVGIALMLVSSE